MFCNCEAFIFSTEFASPCRSGATEHAAPYARLMHTPSLDAPQPAEQDFAIAARDACGRRHLNPLAALLNALHTAGAAGRGRGWGAHFTYGILVQKDCDFEQDEAHFFKVSNRICARGGGGGDYR